MASELPTNESIIQSMMRVDLEEGLRMMLDTAEQNNDEELEERIVELASRYFDLKEKSRNEVLHEKYLELEMKSITQKIFELLHSFERNQAA